jgi:hypothetical protein
LLGLMLPGVSHAGARMKEVTLKAQPLEDSLKSVAEIFGLQIAFLPEDVRGIQAPSLSGELTADQAFMLLLRNSPLEHRFVSEDSVAIARRKASGWAAEAAEVAAAGRAGACRHARPFTF